MSKGSTGIKSKKLNSRWLWSSIGISGGAWLLYAIEIILINKTYDVPVYVLLFVSLLPIVGLILSIIALFKTKSWTRVILAIISLINILVVGLANFTYGFSSFGS